MLVVEKKESAYGSYFVNCFINNCWTDKWFWYRNDAQNFIKSFEEEEN